MFYGIAAQLLLDRDPHGNVQVCGLKISTFDDDQCHFTYRIPYVRARTPTDYSAIYFHTYTLNCILATASLGAFHNFIITKPTQVALIETEKLLITMVEVELKRRAAAGEYSGKFAALSHFFGWALLPLSTVFYKFMTCTSCASMYEFSCRCLCLFLSLSSLSYEFCVSENDRGNCWCFSLSLNHVARTNVARLQSCVLTLLPIFYLVFPFINICDGCNEEKCFQYIARSCPEGVALQVWGSVRHAFQLRRQLLLRPGPCGRSLVAKQADRAHGHRQEVGIISTLHKN